MNPFQRNAIAFRNEQFSAAATLLGLAQGLLADNRLSDEEIRFLHTWLTQNETVAAAWPCSAIQAQIADVLKDGLITEAERTHLVDVLQQLIGGRLDDVAEASFVTELALDHPQAIDIQGQVFCLTGEFVFGPKDICAAAIERRGGAVLPSVSKKVHCVVVGGLGSREWKHGNYGTKIERAIELRDQHGHPKIIHEDVWAASLG